MDVKTKRECEKETVSLMIAIYCRKNHEGKTLCPECAALDAYARLRSDKCPFMETKTFCSNCKVHTHTPVPIVCRFGQCDPDIFRKVIRNPFALSSRPYPCAAQFPQEPVSRNEYAPLIAAGNISAVILNRYGHGIIQGRIFRFGYIPAQKGITPHPDNVPESRFHLLYLQNAHQKLRLHLFQIFS